ncbi:MAG: hypothetical protein J6P73_06180 [Bacteroidales bacterium]|nr:hypothetical protein [Bacteroidales bacterium]
MNNTFELKRFGQVLAKDWKDYFRNFGISLIVWSCIPVLFWIATLIFDTHMDAEGGIALIASLVFSVLIFVPSKVYGKANLSRDGVSFATLPATNVEKFFSMLIYCSILTPIIVGLGSWAIDTLLALLPFGGFNQFVMLPKSHLGLLLFTIACWVVLISSIFVFGNMVFKKRKPGKTIAWAMLIMFVIAMVVQLCGGWAAFARWECSVNQNALPWIMDAVWLVLAIVFYCLTYHRIKNQKY